MVHYILNLVMTRKEYQNIKPGQMLKRKKDKKRFYVLECIKAEKLKVQYQLNLFPTLNKLNTKTLS